MVFFDTPWEICAIEGKEYDDFRPTGAAANTSLLIAVRVGRPRATNPLGLITSPIVGSV